MVVPAAMMIEMAVDQLKSPTAFAGSEWILFNQKKELYCAVPGASDDFKAGYELGLQTARVLLSEMPAAIFNKISI